MGTVDTRFSFPINSNEIFVLSKLSKSEYVKLVSSCVAVVSLVYSSQPEVVAFQTATSGIPTVTNVFENRDEACLKNISSNILPFNPVSENLVDKIEEALQMPKGTKSFNDELYAGKQQGSLVDFVSEIRNSGKS